MGAHWTSSRCAEAVDCTKMSRADMPSSEAGRSGASETISKLDVSTFLTCSLGRGSSIRRVGSKASKQGRGRVVRGSCRHLEGLAVRAEHSARIIIGAPDDDTGRLKFSEQLFAHFQEGEFFVAKATGGKRQAPPRLLGRERHAGRRWLAQLDLQPSSAPMQFLSTAVKAALQSSGAFDGWRSQSKMPDCQTGPILDTKAVFLCTLRK